MAKLPTTFVNEIRPAALGTVTGLATAIDASMGIGTFSSTASLYDMMLVSAVVGGFAGLRRMRWYTVAALFTVTGIAGTSVILLTSQTPPAYDVASAMSYGIWLGLPCQFIFGVITFAIVRSIRTARDGRRDRRVRAVTSRASTVQRA